MYVLTNGHAPELSGANCHAKLIRNSCWKISNNVTRILLTDENIFTVVTGHTKKPKESPTVRNCSNQVERRHDKMHVHTINIQTVTDGINRRVTSCQEIKFDACRSWSEGYWRRLSCDGVITVTAVHALNLKRVHLSAGQCPAHMALESLSFLIDKFARYSSDFKNYFKADSAVNL